MQFEILLFLGLYMIALLGVSIYFSRTNTQEDFLIAGRNRGWVQILMSKFASSIGISWFLAFTAYTYQYGKDALWFVPAYAIAFLFFAFWAVPRIYEFSREYKFYTQGDLVLFKTGSELAKKIIDGMVVITVWVWLLLSYIGGAKIIEFLGVMSYGHALILVSFSIGVYLLLSGYRVVILTDFIQAVIIIVLFIITLGGLFGQTSLAELSKIATEPLPISFVVGMLVYSFFNFFSAADRYQLVFSSKSLSDARKGLAWALAPFLFLLTMLIAVGLFVFDRLPGIDPDLAFVELYTSLLPSELLGVGVIMLVAGVMSSADTGIYVISSYTAMMFKQVKNKVRVVRLVTVVVTIGAAIVSYFVRDIVDATIVAAGLSTSISVAMIYILGGGTKSYKFIASIVFALFGLGAGLIFLGATPALMMIPPLTGSIGLLWPSRWVVGKSEVN